MGYEDNDKTIQRFPQDGDDELEETVRDVELSFEPPRDPEDTPIASPSLEEFPPEIRVYRAETKPRLDAISPETLAQIIFDRHVAQQQPTAFQPVDQQIIYHPLPYLPASGDSMVRSVPLRIILEVHEGNHWERLGIDLYGEVSLGRGDSSAGIVMVNLNPCGASGLGVSRTHLTLRPTDDGLVLIDLNSTNGTRINGEKIAGGVPLILPDRCELSLGRLRLTLYQIAI